MVVVTPLIEGCHTLREKVGNRRVQLKLECLQPTRSFKDRGMKNLISHMKEKEKKKKIVSSSGGNAGYAAANIAIELGLEAIVVCPKTTKEIMIEKIKKTGSKVLVTGENWNEADVVAREILAEDTVNNAYIPPYDHPLLWQGHSTLIDELVEQRGSLGAPSTIFVSVGGGGLLAGVLHGLQRHGGDWVAKTKVCAVETFGAASMHEALKAGKPVSLKKINTIATSLGALSVSEDSLNFALNHKAGCESVLVSDAQALDGCLALLNHHGILVEPACGACVGAAIDYCRTKENITSSSTYVADNNNDNCLLTNENNSNQNQIDDNGDIVIIVCGGSGINLEIIKNFVKNSKKDL